MTKIASPEAQAKLSEALQRLNTCGTDTEIEILGAVLVKVHGALEDHFRDVLIRNAPLSTLEKQEVRGDRGTKRAGWLSLVNLMKEHFGLSQADRRLILDANEVRNKVAHGDSLAPGELPLVQLQQYGEFVQNCLDRSWTSLQPEVTDTAQSSRTSSAPHNQSTQQQSQNNKTSQYGGIFKRQRNGIPTGTQWIVNNITALLYSVVVAIVTQFGVWIAVSIVEACHLAPTGSTTVIPPFAGLVMGAAYYFKMQAIGLVKNSQEWAIVSLMGVGMIYIPAMIMGWIGKAIFPADNAFLSLIFLGSMGAALGLALGVAQYRILRPQYDNIQTWIPASMLDWGFCMGFVPFLKLIRPEVQTSAVAGMLLPIAGFILGKAVTAYQVRQLKSL